MFPLIVTHEFSTRALALEASIQTAEKLVASHGTVNVLVPQAAWIEQRKIDYSKQVPCGVEVSMYIQWLSALWDLWGEGTLFVSDMMRSIITLPIFTKVVNIIPSASYLSKYGSFLEEAVIAPVPDGLSDIELKVMGSVGAYKKRLQELHLIEMSQAEQRLLEMVPERAFNPLIIECPGELSEHTKAFLTELSEIVEIHVFTNSVRANIKDECASENEIMQARSLLFSGKEGVVSEGRVLAAEVHGLHAQEEVVVELLQRLHAQDIDYKDMALVMANPASADPGLINELAQQSIPFQLEFNQTLDKIPLGAAFCNLYRIRLMELTLQEESPSIMMDESYEYMVDLISSPYAGIPSTDAEAMQYHWRRHGRCNFAKRMAHMREGYRGPVKSTVWKEHLKYLARLLDQKRDFKSCVCEMLANKFMSLKGSKEDVEALRHGVLPQDIPEEMLDDVRAASAITDYLLLCEQLKCAPQDIHDRGLAVAVQRSFGNEGVLICTPENLALQQKKACVFCNMDVENYPMGSAPGPFDILLEKMDMAVNHDESERQRLRLLNTMEQSGEAFAFYRVCHNSLGEETCQSALWDELVAVYRSEADEAAHTKPQEIPVELQQNGCALVRSEGHYFRKQSEELLAKQQLERGVLTRDASVAMMPMNYETYKECYSPTALEAYYRCPYNWMISRRVNSFEIDRDFDEITKGNFAHEMLYEFYKLRLKEGKGRVTPENLEEALQQAQEVFVQTTQRLDRADRLFVDNIQKQLALEEVAEQVNSLICRDAEFLPGFSPTYLELDLRLDEPLTYAGVPMTGKVDRIDVNEKGEAIIIDYKLSALSQGYGYAGKEELPEHIQTDIYALLIERYFERMGEPVKVVGSVYRSYKHNCLRGSYESFVDWGVEEVSSVGDKVDTSFSGESYHDYLIRVEAAVKQCLERIAKGDIARRPLEGKGVCEYCPVENCSVGKKA